MTRRALFGALTLAAFLTQPPHAHAKRTEDIAFPFADVWPTAVRFLRVDEGYTLVERDEQAGYILFRFMPPGQRKEAQGSLELVRHGAHTEVIVAMPTRPEHHERVLIERLLAKVKRELGNAAPSAPRDPGAMRRTPPDAGTE